MAIEDSAEQVEAFHEFLIQAESIGSIGNLAANLMLGDMPKFQADLVGRAIASEVQRRVELALSKHEVKLDALSAGAKSVPPPKPLPSHRWWLRFDAVGGEHSRAHLFESVTDPAPCGVRTTDGKGSWVKLTTKNLRDIAARDSMKEEKVLCEICKAAEHVDR